jgi:hypothetical protein
MHKEPDRFQPHGLPILQPFGPLIHPGLIAWRQLIADKHMQASSLILPETIIEEIGLRIESHHQ